MHAAVGVGAPATVPSAPLSERFASRGEAEFADQLLSAMASSSAATPRPGWPKEIKPAAIGAARDR